MKKCAYAAEELLAKGGLVPLLRFKLMWLELPNLNENIRYLSQRVALRRSYLFALLFMPIACAASAIIYIEMATSGYYWATAASKTSGNVVMLLYAGGIISALSQRSTQLLLLNVVAPILLPIGCILLILIVYATGIIPKYSRIFGVSVSFLAMVGLTSFILISAQNKQKWREMLILVALSFPSTIAFAHIYLTAPLVLEMRSADLRVDCYFQRPASDYSSRNAHRITSVQDVEFGVFVGEGSPRIYKTADQGLQYWSYSKRRFLRPREMSGVPVPCGD